MWIVLMLSILISGCVSTPEPEPYGLEQAMKKMGYGRVRCDAACRDRMLDAMEAGYRPPSTPYPQLQQEPDYQPHYQYGTVHTPEGRTYYWNSYGY